MRGTIALDIDGTLTTGSHDVPERTTEYLARLAKEGWLFIFVTGRTFSSGYKALKHLPFPYYFAVQNGALILEMPSQRIVAKKYLDRSIFLEMDAICSKHSTDFVVYAGFEHEDHCYFRPHHFSPSLLDYLQRRVKTYEETWHPLTSYSDMALDLFPSVKCFGPLPSAKELASKIEQRLGLHVPVIRDPFSWGVENGSKSSLDYYVVQATHPQISKGQALLDFLEIAGRKGKVIAAGDDYNDISMFSVADVAVVMATGPEDMLKNADIIAPSAAEEGIITGLEAAIKKCSG